ncbi:MAG TPA: hypothetical protein DCR04_03930 [Flavobacteriales bacterium]|nr:hypothetical protein [Flavobacteriales bacterium]
MIREQLHKKVNRTYLAMASAFKNVLKSSQRFDICPFGATKKGFPNGKPFLFPIGKTYTFQLC